MHRTQGHSAPLGHPETSQEFQTPKAGEKPRSPDWGDIRDACGQEEKPGRQGLNCGRSEAQLCAWERLDLPGMWLWNPHLQQLGTQEVLSQREALSKEAGHVLGTQPVFSEKHYLLAPEPLIIRTTWGLWVGAEFQKIDSQAPSWRL